MNLTKPQLFILGIIGIFAFIFILILSGILPGLQQKDKPLAIKATIKFWGVFDTENVYKSIFDSFREQYKEVRFEYRSFQNQETYEAELLDALAAGTGPDIFMLPNIGLDKHLNKISPVPNGLISVFQLRSLFPEVVESDFTNNGQIYGLPLYIDTLALFYNKDIFNQKAIINLPSNWDELGELIPIFREYDENNKLKRSAIALGGSNNNIDYAAHIVQLLMLQKQMFQAGSSKNPLQFSSSDFEQALNYYLSFSKPESPFYSWNSEMPYSLDAFTQSKTAMFLNYSSVIKTLKNRSRFLNFRIAPVPQLKNTKNPVAYPKYWAYVVSNQSKIIPLAWEFIIGMTTNPAIAEIYSSVADKPPALLSLIGNYLQDPDFSVFAKQAFIAKSLHKTNEKTVDGIISDTIETMLQNNPNASQIINDAGEKLSQLFR